MRVHCAFFGCAVLMVTSATAFGQLQSTPSASNPRADAPKGAVADPRKLIAPSHPDEINAQLGQIAEQMLAAGLTDEARQLQSLQLRVRREHYQRLLAVHKESQAKATNIRPVSAIAVATEPQISLRLRMVELHLCETAKARLELLFKDQETLGSDASEATTGVFDPKEVSEAIDELCEQGMAKILTEPQLTLLNGCSAKFRSGQEVAIPGPPETGRAERDASAPGGPLEEDDVANGPQLTRFVGTSVVATATILEDRRIMLSLTAEHSTFVPGGVPGINRRRIQSDVEIRDGQSLVLGGLKSHRMRTEISRIPVLGELPGIGKLFSTKKHSQEEHELIVVITPEIVQPGDDVPPVGNKPAR